MVLWSVDKIMLEMWLEKNKNIFMTVGVILLVAGILLLVLKKTNILQRWILYVKQNVLSLSNSMKKLAAFILSFSGIIAFIVIIKILSYDSFIMLLVNVIDFFIDHKVIFWMVIISLFVISLFVISFIRFQKGGLIKYIKEKKRVKEIELTKEYSRKYHALLEINEQQKFWKLQPKMVFERRVETRKAFKLFDLESFFVLSVREHYDELTEYIDKTLENAKMFETYVKEIAQIDSITTHEDAQRAQMSVEKFELREDELLKYYIIKKPVCQCLVECKVLYISPQGRNHEKDSRIYNMTQITETMKKIKQEAGSKHQKDLSEHGPQYERALMTDELRYLVFKRDGFRCKICGHGQEDGVKLHVDHIRPVSKGGRTVMSNLRTLCSACNLGKRDKYDENGLN